MFELIVKLLLAYFIGTIMGGLLIARLRGVDLRSGGSGNIGATNALRTQGKGFALAVLLIDLGKGVAAVSLLPALSWPFPQNFVVPPEWLAYLCGIAVSIGHVFPVWNGFSGGKGVATLAGVFLALMPQAFGYMLIGFVLTIVLSGYVSLGSLLCGLIAVAYVWIDGGTLLSGGGIFSVLMALLIAFTHRQNILRLLNGTENRFQKAMLLHRWLKS